MFLIPQYREARNLNTCGIQYVITTNKSGELFPVNFEQVWPLVYTERSNAIREMVDNFMQDVDYQVSLKNEQNLTGGRPAKKVHFTVQCIDWFHLYGIPYKCGEQKEWIY